LGTELRLNAKSIVFGDVRPPTPSAASPASLQRRDELHSDNGQIGFRARSRVDGRVVLADAARALAHSTT
jgi:HK97 family phage major capsid protein